MDYAYLFSNNIICIIFGTIELTGEFLVKNVFTIITKC